MLLPGFILGACLLGAFLVIKGIWPRRRGSMPICRRCGYNLTGLTAQRCPECGSLLEPGNVVLGERHRSVVRILIGLTCLGAAAFAWFISPRIDPYHYLPTFVLMHGLESSNSQRQVRAWNELMRRDRTGKLSAEQENRLIDRCLQEQAGTVDRTLTQNMLGHLGYCLSKGRLSPERRQRFFDQILTLKLVSRARVRAGAVVLYQIDLSLRGPVRGLAGIVKVDGEMVDGRETKHTPITYYTLYNATGSGIITNEAAAEPPGNHVLVVIPEVTFVDELGRRRYQAHPVLRSTFQVTVPQTRPAAAPANAALQSTLRDLIQPELHQAEGRLVYEIRFRGELPVDVSFDVYVRQGEQERKIGAFAGKKGQKKPSWPVEQRTRTDVSPQLERAEVVLRSGEEAAEHTIDILDFWQGELIYRNVPTSQAAPSRGGRTGLDPVGFLPLSGPFDRSIPTSKTANPRPGE